MIDIASLTRLRVDRQTYRFARRELKASLTWATAEQVPVRVVYGLVARSSRQTGKDCFSYMGRRCEKWLSVGDRTRNLSLPLLVPPVKRRKGPLPFNSSTQVAKRKPDKNSKRLAPGSLSRYGIFFFSN